LGICVIHAVSDRQQFFYANIGLAGEQKYYFIGGLKNDEKTRVTGCSFSRSIYQNRSAEEAILGN